MKLSEEDKREAFKVVRSYMQKRRYLQSKGVSKGALPKPVSHRELIKAYVDSPTGLRKRLNNLKSFSTRGEVYKTEGGVSLTKTLAKYKNSEIRRGEAYQIDRYNKLKNFRNSNAKGYRKTKVDYLKDKNIENVKYSQLATINYSIENPEQIKVRKQLAVENFFKSLECGFADDNVVTQNPMVKARIQRYLEKFSEDEISDLLTTNPTIRAIMDYYRGEDPEQPIEFAGTSWEDLIWQLYEEMPEIAKGVYRRRKQNA